MQTDEPSKPREHLPYRRLQTVVSSPMTSHLRGYLPGHLRGYLTDGTTRDLRPPFLPRAAISDGRGAVIVAVPLRPSSRTLKILGDHRASSACSSAARRTICTISDTVCPRLPTIAPPLGGRPSPSGEPCSIDARVWPSQLGSSSGVIKSSSPVDLPTTSPNCRHQQLLASKRLPHGAQCNSGLTPYLTLAGARE